MKKITCLLSLISCLFVATTAYAADDLHKTHDWVLNIRRIGMDWSKTDVKNAPAYQSSPIAQLKAAGQDFFKGVFDAAFEYRHDRFSWDNGLLMEYGRTELRPEGKPNTIVENADKILLFSNFDYRLWEYAGFSFGPTARAAYDTEFTPNNGVPRHKMARIGAGLALFDHPIIQDLYAIGIYEYDFTYDYNKISKSAAEFGWRIGYEISDGITVSTNGYFREYMSYSGYLGSNLKWDFMSTVRLDSNLWGDFTMGPYISYRNAKSVETPLIAENFMMGISFNYITKFGL